MPYPAWILERSFGGISSAVSPNSVGEVGPWPEGRMAPGAREACDRIIQACNGKVKDDPPCFVFLVGGAGNGKSKIARDVAEGIKGALEGEATRFARRKYTYRLDNGGGLIVLNDATIPPDTGENRTALAGDIASAIDGTANLLACINRGVLIGEVAATGPVPANAQEAAATLVAKWLLDPDFKDYASADQFQAHLETSPQNGARYYLFAQLFIGGEPKANIHAVYMDQASLLEVWPSEGQAQDNVASRPLQLPPLEQVPILRRTHTDGVTAEFARPMSELANALSECAKSAEFDPIAANALSLSSLRSANALCAVMRGAEVMSGTNFTYRELWALCSHALVGPSTPADLLRLDTWTKDKLSKAKDGDPEAIISLSALRTHMVLFDAGSARADDCPFGSFVWPTTGNEALASIAAADPVRDFGAEDDASYSVAGDLLATIEEGIGPGYLLAQSKAQVSAYWTDFDTAFEKAVTGLVSPHNPKTTLVQRSKILSWYGRYMFRLLAVSQGWPAHSNVINEWQKAWLESRSNKLLPRRIEEALLAVILPGEDANDSSCFPILKSRVSKVPARGVALELEIRKGDFEVEVGHAGDGMVIKLRDRNARSKHEVEAVLDYHLLREALAKFAGRGFTDSLSVIEPRIERVRAGLLANQSGKTGQTLNFIARSGGRTVKFRIRSTGA